MTAVGNTIALVPAPGSVRGLIVAPSVPAWPAKDPSETVGYGADFAALLPPGDPIVQLDYAVTPPSAADVLLGTWSGTVVVLQISGGSTGTPATLTITVTLLSGDQVTRAVVLPILIQAATSPATPDALTVSGFALTVAGQPLQLDQGA